MVVTKPMPPWWKNFLISFKSFTVQTLVILENPFLAKTFGFCSPFVVEGQTSTSNTEMRRNGQSVPSHYKAGLGTLSLTSNLTFYIAPSWCAPHLWQDTYLDQRAALDRISPQAAPHASAATAPMDYTHVWSHPTVAPPSICMAIFLRYVSIKWPNAIRCFWRNNDIIWCHYLYKSSSHLQWFVLLAFPNQHSHYYFR